MNQTILTRAELEANDPEGGRGGRWLCPLPGCADHTDKRRHRSLDVEPEGQKRGVFFCHRCGAGGQLKDYWKDFVPESNKAKTQRVRLRRDAEESRRLEEIGARFRGKGKPLTVAALLAIGTSGQAPAAVIAPRESGSPRTVHQGLKETLYRAGSLQGLGNEQARAFLSSRGFSEFSDTLTRVRFAPDFGRREATQEKGAYRGAPAIVFPISDDAGQLVAFQGRKIAPRDGETKVLSFGPKSAGVFWAPGALDAWQAGEPIALTEAPLDALTLALCGVPAVALCGSSAPPEFLLRGCFNRRYWLAFDADEAGDKAAQVIGAELKLYGAIVERLRPEGAKDWNEALQAGGAVWDRTAEALRALIARENVARLVLGEPPIEGPPERDPMHRTQPHAPEKIGAQTLNTGHLTKPTENLSKPVISREMVATGRLSKPIESSKKVAPIGATGAKLAEVGRESPHGLEQNGTEIQPAEAEASKLRQFGQVQSENQAPQNHTQALLNHNQTTSIGFSPLAEASGVLSRAETAPIESPVLAWACSESRRGFLPEPAESLTLPSGNVVPPDHAAAWLLAAESRSAGLAHHSATSVDCTLALAVVQRDMVTLALWARHARLWLDSPYTHEGACCPLPAAVEELRGLVEPVSMAGFGEI